MRQEYQQVQTNHLNCLPELFIHVLEVRKFCIQQFDKSFNGFVGSMQVIEQFFLFGMGSAAAASSLRPLPTVSCRPRGKFHLCARASLCQISISITELGTDLREMGKDLALRLSDSRARCQRWNPIDVL